MRKRLLISIMYLSWFAYAGGLAYLGWRGHWAIGIAWLLGVPLMQWVYRELPTLKHSSNLPAREDITITAVPRPGCRSCSVMEQRIEELRKQLIV